ncbi:MAG: hypothetical protein KJ638_03235 [Chloroflexi bacterium]|nr:hypothetical protein [Chloroflexota bacterium]
MGDIAIRVDNLGKMYRIGVTEKQAQRWSAPAALLFSPGGAPGELSAAWSPGGQIVLAWEDLETGLVYTSWTPTASAMDETAWAAPDALPLPGSPARAPQLAASEQGRLFLACALLYNEGRGVYLLEAPPLEPGQAPQWGAPRLVFDAAAAGWDSVADPRLALGPDETPHLLWLHTRFSPESAPVELVYGRPVDGGGDWPAPALVAHEPAGWSQILAAPDGTLHRAWQEESSGRFSVWHQYSTDGGLAWSAPVRVTGAGRARAESLALEALSGGGLRLLEITAGSFSSAPGLVFQEWVWGMVARGWVGGG